MEPALAGIAGLHQIGYLGDGKKKGRVSGPSVLQ